jgi:hypothetical protein
MNMHMDMEEIIWGGGRGHYQIIPYVNVLEKKKCVRTENGAIYRNIQKWKSGRPITKPL